MRFGILEQKQSGFSALSLLLIIIILGVAGILAGKLIPPYLDHQSIVRSIEEVKNTENIEHSRSTQVVEELKKAVSRHVREQNKLPDVAKIAYLINGADDRVLGVEYEVVVPVIANISILLKFNAEQRMSAFAVTGN